MLLYIENRADLSMFSITQGGGAIQMINSSVLYLESVTFQYCSASVSVDGMLFDAFRFFFILLAGRGNYAHQRRDGCEPH